MPRESIKMKNKNKDNMITGTVRTNKVGSDCEFVICSKEEWDILNDVEKNTLLIEAMWNSGILDVYPND